jgi:flagellar capping protein FliD
MSILERLDRIKINIKELRYKKILKRIQQIEQDMIDLTHDYTREFDKINEFMGCLCAKLEELQSQIQSLTNSKTNR